MSKHHLRYVDVPITAPGATGSQGFGDILNPPLTFDLAAGESVVSVEAFHTAEGLMASSLTQIARVWILGKDGA